MFRRAVFGKLPLGFGVFSGRIVAVAADIGAGQFDTAFLSGEDWRATASCKCRDNP